MPVSENDEPLLEYLSLTIVVVVGADDDVIANDVIFETQPT